MFVLSSSFVLGLILGISLLVIGETSMKVNGSLDFAAFDGLWVIVALPAASMILFVLLSPLSFLVHKLLTRRRDKIPPPDA
jgi:galactitol-specific phosphotransferase system IIC component